MKVFATKVVAVFSKSALLFSAAILVGALLALPSVTSQVAAQEKGKEPEKKEPEKKDAEKSTSAEPSAASTRQFSAAAALQNKELWDLAADEWKQFLTKFPKDPRSDSAQHYLGTCYMKAKKFDEALKTFETVLKEYPNFKKIEDTYLNLGITQFSAARDGKPPMYDAAAGTFGTLVEKFPKSPYVAQALYYRGESLYARDKKAEAAQAYAALVAGHPTSPLLVDALYLLGVTSDELGQRDAAAKSYDEFLTKFATHALAPEVQMRRGEIYFAGGKYPEAAGLFALASQGKDFALADYSLLRQAACMYQTKKYLEAAALYDQLPTKFPQSKYIAAAQLASGKSQYLLGNYGEARTVLAKPLAAGGVEAPEAGHWIARSFLKQKESQPAEALKAAESALKLPKAADSTSFVQLQLDRADALFETPDRRPEATAAYLEIAAKHPKDPLAPEALYMAGFSALQEKRYDSAIEHAAAFAKAYPDNEFAPDVAYLSGESHLQLKKYPESQALFNTVHTKHAGHSLARQAWIREGQAQYAEKKYPEAIATLTAFLKTAKAPDENAEIAEAKHLLGRCQLEQKKFDEAQLAFADALAAKADWRQADETLLLLAHSLGQLKKPAEAQAKFTELITKFPKSSHLPEAHYRLAESLYGAGEFAKAATEYSLVPAQHPDSAFTAHALYGLGWAQFQGAQPAEAVKSLDTLITKHAQSELAPKGRYPRALAQHQLKKYAEAIADLEEFLKSNPSQREASDARYVLGLCQVGLDKLPEAEGTFTGLLKADADYTGGDKVRYELGWARKGLKKEAEAVESFGELASKFPQSPLAAEALYHVAEFNYQNGAAQAKAATEAINKGDTAGGQAAKASAAKSFEGALKPYDESLTKSGKTELGEKAAHKLAWTYFKLDNFDQAGQKFAQQVVAFPDGKLTADGLFMQAESLFKQAKYTEASTVYDRAIVAFAKATNPTPDFVATALLHAAQSQGKLKPAPNWKKAIELLDAIPKQYPDSSLVPEALYEKAWALQNTDKLDEALKLYEQVTDLAATEEVGARSWFQRGEIYFKKKDHAEAIRNFVKASVYPFPVWAAYSEFEMGRCFEVLNQKDKAKSVYEGLLKRYPDSEQANAAKDRLKALAGS